MATTVIQRKTTGFEAEDRYVAGLLNAEKEHCYPIGSMSWYEDTTDRVTMLHRYHHCYCTAR